MDELVEERLNAIKEWDAPVFAPLLDALLSERSPIYVVGGSVRDYLLGSTLAVTDLDLVMAAPVLDVARRTADRLGWAYYPLDEQRDVARLVGSDPTGQRFVCDLAALRGDLEVDLNSRDFTINSLALALSAGQPPALIDVCGGVDDLRRRRLRTVMPANLDQDPLRMLRAVRFACKFGFYLEAGLAIAIRQRAAAIQSVSEERIRDELWKILALADPGRAMRLAVDLELLHYLVPELADTIGVEQSAPHHLDVFAHTLLVMDSAASLRDWLLGRQDKLEPAIFQVLAKWTGELRDHFARQISSDRTQADWLVWHALFHDTGKPATRTVELDPKGATRYRFINHEAASAQMAEERLGTLRFSRNEIQISKRVIEAHMRPHYLHQSFRGMPIGRRAAHRYFRDLAGGARGAQNGIDVLLLAIADRQSIGDDRGDDWRDYLNHIEQLLTFGFQTVSGTGKPLLNGQMLMTALDLSPGPLVGRLLAHIEEAQATGEITSTEGALDLAAHLLETGENNGSQ